MATQGGRIYMRPKTNPFCLSSRCSTSSLAVGNLYKWPLPICLRALDESPRADFHDFIRRNVRSSLPLTLSGLDAEIVIRHPLRLLAAITIAFFFLSLFLSDCLSVCLSFVLLFFLSSLTWLRLPSCTLCLSHYDD